jgi:hypothetical protein
MSDLPEFQHVFRLDRGGRKGQLCKIVGLNAGNIQIKFTDGTVWITSRMALRRATEKELFDADATNQSKLAASGQRPPGEK